MRSEASHYEEMEYQEEPKKNSEENRHLDPLLMVAESEDRTIKNQADDKNSGEFLSGDTIDIQPSNSSEGPTIKHIQHDKDLSKG